MQEWNKSFQFFNFLTERESIKSFSIIFLNIFLNKFSFNLISKCRLAVTGAFFIFRKTYGENAIKL